MAETILFDLTRLFYRVRRPSCSGIDRVLLEHALHFKEEDHVVFCVWSGKGLRRVPPWLTNLLLDHLQHRWLARRKGKRRTAALPLRWLGTRRKAIRTAFTKACAPMNFANDSERKWIYLNASHQHIDRMADIKALAPAGNLRTVVMLHDIMPITHPEYHSKELQAEFDKAVEQITQTVDLVLTNSQATASELHDYCSTNGFNIPPLQSVALGGPERVELRPPQLPKKPRFLYLGTLSERKNIQLLDALWQELCKNTEDPPHLHLVGAAARDYEPPASLLRLPHVHWHRSMRDRELHTLLDEITALLAPSRAEGFGLPILEALARWVPVLASDLPAHREVGGDVVEYLPVDDTEAWSEAILRYSQSQSSARDAQLTRLEEATLPLWSQHCKQVLSSVSALF